MLHELATAIMKRCSVRALSWKKDRHPIIYFHVLKYFRLGRNLQSRTLIHWLNEEETSGNRQSGEKKKAIINKAR